MVLLISITRLVNGTMTSELMGDSSYK